MPNSTFTSGTVCQDGDLNVGCQNVQDICDIIKDDITYPYKNDTQTAVFQGVSPKDGLMKVLGTYINFFALNKASVSYTTNNGSQVFQATLPNNGIFNGKGGPKVVEMPMGVGDQRIRTGFKVYRPDESYKYRFHITQEVLDATVGTPASTVIANNENRIVLPKFFAIFASDEAECGCAARCCADGWREWFLFSKATGKQEKIWVRTVPPAGIVDTRQYGRLPDGRYAVYAVRGVGASPMPGAASIMPTDFGTPIVMRLGDEIKIGNVIPVAKSGCLPCASVRPTHFKRQEFRNYAQKMVDQIYCYTEEDTLRNTYHQQPNFLQNEYRDGLNKAMVRFYNTLMYGQQQAFVGSDLDNATLPGVGDGDGTNAVPFATDGLFTLLRKHSQKAVLQIKEGCDNRCLVDEVKFLIESLTNFDYSSGNWILIGDDYIFHMIQTMIVNKVVPNDPTVAQNLLFGANQSLLTDSMFSIDQGSALPNINNNIFSYQSLRIGKRNISFVKDLEMQTREPGVMYLLNLDAIEFFIPNRQNSLANGYLPATAVPGSLMPSIITNREMIDVNGQFNSFVPQNCPNTIWAYLWAGVWYEPASLPNTFRIELKGVNNAGVVVPLSDIGCGCYNSNLTAYKSLLCEI